MPSIQSADPQDSSGWFPSIYYAETTVNCRLETAWELLLNYPAWNPGFVGAAIIRVCGEPHSEGEVVEIIFVDDSGVPLAPRYARTIKVEPCRCIAWYCYPKLDDSFRIFLEFRVMVVTSGVRFSIQWYALDRLPTEALAEHRTATDATVQNLAVAFKAYCEAQAEAKQDRPL